MKVAIAGGTGLIGHAVTNELISQGHHVKILTRNKSNKQSTEQLSYVEWLNEEAEPEKNLHEIDAIINLAGENLNSGRWTSAKKTKILHSRLDATSEIVRIIENMNHKPAVLISGSAVGYYGTSYSKVFTEKDEPGGDFLADVVEKWETEATKAPSETRVVLARFGVVLAAHDGALKKMLPAFKFFIGGKLGTGEQWMSWIHIDDVARALVHCIENNDISGPVNMTAPEPKKMKDFGKTLATVIHRPFWAPVPSVILKLILGEMSNLVLEGQKVLPEKLAGAHFSFTYKELDQALKHLLTEKSS